MIVTESPSFTGQPQFRLFYEFANHQVHNAFFAPLLVEFSDAPLDGRGVCLAIVAPDLWNGRVCHLLDQIHRNLPWHLHRSCRALVVQLFYSHAKEVGYSVLDSFDSSSSYAVSVIVIHCSGPPLKCW